MNEIEQNIQKSENIQDPIYSELQTGLPSENYKETNAVFNWDTGTKTMLGVDDNDISHLISEEPSEEINQIKDAVNNNQEVSQEMLGKIPGMLSGIKKWSMSSTKGDWYKSLEKAGLAFSDFLEQGSRLITGGQIRELFDDQARIFRKGNITLNVTNEEIKNGFLNMREDFQPGAENHPFNEDGNLKEGWQEISQSVASADAIQYENQEFSPAPMFEYILQYGLGGKKIYDVLGNVSKLKKAPIIKAVLAELGVEFAGATQKKDDVNFLNMLEGFGFGEESGTVLNILRESLAAGDDDTALERKLKNAAGNAPVGLGLGLTIKAISKTKTLYNFIKKLKYNKEGRTELSKKLGYSIEKDNGINGDFKVQDKNGITIASFATKEEADDLSKVLGDGHEVQEIKSLGAAATSNEAPTTSVAMQGDTGLVKLNISDENLAISNYDRVRFDEGSERPFKVFLKGQENHQKSFTTQEEAENFINSDIANNKIIEENNARIRSKSEKPFYSNVEKAISNFTFKKQPGNQILATLNNTAGIKQSEIQDLGLDTFLKDNPSVTKEQLDDFIADKSLTTRVKETVLEGTRDIGGDVGDINFAVGFEDTRPDVLTNANSFDDAKLIVNNDEGLYNELTEFGFAKGISDDDMMNDEFVEDFLQEQYGITRTFPESSPTKFSDQTLPGGEDYKEILITAPGTPQVYTKHHFNKDVPPGENLIAHARFNTREINGKKTLFIEEIQSDLHQAGRKEGYNTKDAQKAQSEFDEYSLFLADKYDLNPQQNLAMYGGLKNMTDAEVNKYQLLQSKVNFGGVADAPFKKNWHELTMKRLIKYAVDNGFEAISLTPGKVQNDRYDLSTVADSIRAEKINGGTKDGQYELNITGKGRNISKVIPENELEQYLGKDLSQKIINESSTFPDGKEYSGLDLKVGGEGMIGFYDKMLPKFLNKFGKKYNAKLETGSIGNEYSIYKASDIKENMPYTAIGSSNNTYAIYNIIFNSDAGMNGRYELTMKKDGKVQTIDFDPNLDKMKRSLAEELEGFKVPQINQLNKIEVPFMVITPEMKKNILTEGVPIAQVEDQQEKNTALV